MPRTKGAKNRAARPAEERIAAVQAEIETLQEQIRNRKEELKRLNEEKAEEDRNRILRAVADSGKTVEEILDLLEGRTERPEEIPAAG